MDSSFMLNYDPFKSSRRPMSINMNDLLDKENSPPEQSPMTDYSNMHYGAHGNSVNAKMRTGGTSNMFDLPFVTEDVEEEEQPSNRPFSLALNPPVLKCHSPPKTRVIETHIKPANSATPEREPLRARPWADFDFGTPGTAIRINSQWTAQRASDVSSPSTVRPARTLPPSHDVNHLKGDPIHSVHLGEGSRIKTQETRGRTNFIQHSVPLNDTVDRPDGGFRTGSRRVRSRHRRSMSADAARLPLDSDKTFNLRDLKFEDVSFDLLHEDTSFVAIVSAADKSMYHATDVPNVFASSNKKRSKSQTSRPLPTVTEKEPVAQMIRPAAPTYSSLAIQTSPAQEGTPRRAAIQPPSPPERPRSYVLKRTTSVIEKATRRPRPTTVCLSSISEAKAAGWTMPSVGQESIDVPALRRQTTRESVSVRPRDSAVGRSKEDPVLRKTTSMGPSAIAGTHPLLRVRSDRVQDRMEALAERDGISRTGGLSRTSSMRSIVDRAGPTSNLTRTSSVRDIQPRTRPTGRESIAPIRPAATPVKSTPIKSAYSRATTERDPVARIRTKRDSIGSVRSPTKSTYVRPSASKPAPVSFRMAAPSTPPRPPKRTSSRPMSSIGFVSSAMEPPVTASSTLLKRSSSVASVRPGDRVDLTSRYKVREDLGSRVGRDNIEKLARPSSRLSVMGLRRTESLSKV